jgi:hypothetical protein
MHGGKSSRFASNAEHGGSQGSRKMVQNNLNQPSLSSDQPMHDNNPALEQQLQSLPMPTHALVIEEAQSGSRNANELESLQTKQPKQRKQKAIKKVSKGRGKPRQQQPEKKRLQNGKATEESKDNNLNFIRLFCVGVIFE